MPDASSTWLSTEPLVNVSVGVCTDRFLAMRLTSPQASTTIMALINSLCVMLRTTPFHRENYARLVLTVIIQFYQRCSDRFQTLITSQASSDQDPRVALGAQWAQIPEIAACLSDLYHALVDMAILWCGSILADYIISGNCHEQERTTPPRAQRGGSADQRQANRERGANWSYEKCLRTLQFVSKRGMLIRFPRRHDFLYATQVVVYNWAQSAEGCAR